MEEGKGDKIERKEDRTRVFFTFGRFQPPTSGHKVVIDAIKNLVLEGKVPESGKSEDSEEYKAAATLRTELDKEEGKQRGDGYVFLSSTKDATKNPLSVYTKVKYIKKMYPESPISFINTTECKCTGIFPIIDSLTSAGYTRLIMVIGEDRFETFSKLLKPKGVLVISAGVRITDSESTNVKAMSGTKMRLAAVKGNNASIASFKNGVTIGSMTNTNAMNLMSKIRNGLGSKGGQRKSLKTRKNKKHIRNTKTRKYIARR